MFSDWWRNCDVGARDAGLAMVFTVLAFSPTLSALGAQIGDLFPRRPSDALGVVLLLGQTAPLAMRTRWPAVCVVIVGVAFSVHQLLAYPQTFGSLGVYVALYAVGAHQERFRRVLPVVLSVLYVALAIILRLRGSPDQFLDFVVFYLALVVCWMAGSWMRRRRAQEAEQRRQSARAATAAERARLARELHDVVTHHVTAVVVQADATQFALTDTERVAAGLSTISSTGRRALTDLRSLLNVLEATGESESVDRTSTVGRLGDLVEQTRLAGQPVHLTEEGEQSPASDGAELTAYRVVQESLTNAVKYATGRPTAVRIRHRDDQIDIEVTTDGPPSGTPAVHSGHGISPGGRGLAGLRERVETLGGVLTSDTGPDGGFVVSAEIPARREQ